MGGWRNGRRARLRTVWTKVLKGSTPFPPISFSGYCMKKYDYYRPVSKTGRTKKIRKSPVLSIVKSLILFGVFIGVCVAVYLLAQRAYEAVVASRLGNWTPSAVSVSGVKGVLLNELTAAAQEKTKAPFSAQDAQTLETSFMQRYPQLRQVDIKRGLMSGKLKISVKLREPLAKLQLPSKEQRLLDEDGTLYSAPNMKEINGLVSVELTGPVPAKLEGEWVDLLQSLLKLKEQLKFTSLHFDLTNNTVDMQLAVDGVLHFGPAKNLRQKVRRAAQIEKLVRAKQLGPHTLDFTYFDEGKVFLRQTAH